MTAAVRFPLALLVAAALTGWAWSLGASGGAARDLSVSLALGAAFGVVLQRSRFCFLCNFRDFLIRRDPRGLIAILIALAIGTLGYAAVFGAWLPVPSPDRLPPTAHIGPVSWLLAIASFVFGIGMAVSGSCLSAHFYRLGEGSPTSPFALLGAAIGFGLGFLSWNSLYLSPLSGSTPVWLPHTLGYAGTIGLTLAVLAVITIILLALSRTETVSGEILHGDTPLKAGLRRIFVERWPAGVAGVLIGLISTLAYFRVAPLGVTAELGSLARTAGSAWQILPETLFSLDGLRGCATIVKDTVLSNNGIFVIGLVGASFASALLANQFQPQRPTLSQIGNGLFGGILMGWGAMTALGCTVGVLLSGIHAGALSGWIFLFACSFGVFSGLKIKTLLTQS